MNIGSWYFNEINTFYHQAVQFYLQFHYTFYYLSPREYTKNYFQFSYNTCILMYSSLF